MDQLTSISSGDKAGSRNFYIQQELFSYWNARLPASVFIKPGKKADEPEYSSALYLDLFDPLFGLNKEQINLLQAGQKILSVTGPAGTGKSAMLTILAAYWIKQKKCKPGEILLITLSEEEIPALRQNLENMAGEQSVHVVISTFEKICFQLLAANKQKITRLYNQSERIRFLTLVFPFLSSQEINEFSAYLENYHKAVSPGKAGQEELAEAYLGSLEKMGACDTAALVNQTYRFLIGNPGTLANFKNRYKILLIDDFQDINPGQYKIFSLLANDDLLDDEIGKKRKVIIFHNPHKAVYHQPAKENPFYYRFLAEFAEKEIVFRKHYGPQKSILQAADAIAKRIDRKRKAGLNTTYKKAAGIGLYRVIDKNAEAELIAGTIHAFLTGTRKVYPGDIAVLSRNRQSNTELIQALKAYALPYYIHRQGLMIHRLPFSCIFAFFHFMLNEKDITSLAEILLNVLTDFTPGDVQGIFLAGNRKEENLTMLVNRLYTSRQLTDSQYSQLNKLLAFVKKLKSTVNNQGIAPGLELILDSWKNLDLRSPSGLAPADVEYALLFNQAQSYKKLIVEFIQCFYFDTGAMLYQVKKERIHLMDFTAARGLDFKIVFITGMEEGNCPCYTDDLAREYRRFYLALTRAREEVILTSCQNCGGKNFPLSSFIADLGLLPETTSQEALEPDTVYNQLELAALPGAQ